MQRVGFVEENDFDEDMTGSAHDEASSSLFKDDEELDESDEEADDADEDLSDEDEEA